MHVGHPLGYIGTDVLSRYKRMAGFNVLHSLSFDTFGLPAEQHAVQTGTHPRVATEANIERYRAQLDRLGMAYDWRRSSATTDPSFYRWTQWIFLQIFNAWYDPALRKARPIAELIAEFESGIRAVPANRTWGELDPQQRRRVVDSHRLVYVAHTPINWCPALGTELHDLEITTDGRSERGNFPVFRRTMRQWMMRITAYADRLRADLDRLDWPELVKARQRQWTARATDWLFSRPRYWGEPFPIVYDETGEPVALPESMLPLELPEIADFSPRTFAPDDATSEPETPLARATDWVEVELDLGEGPKRYRRETNTMPQWAGTCWFALRQLDPTNDAMPVDPETERYWTGPTDNTDPGGVDLYVGGAEHAVLHLLYVRFWHKVLYDLGHVSSAEPFRRLFTQGHVQAYAYADPRGVYVEAEQVVQRGGKYFHGQQEVTRGYGRLAKALKNLVTPDEICARYGADTFRVYQMAAAPLHASRAWDTGKLVGFHRFLQRVWRLAVDEQTGRRRVVETPADDETRRLLHRTIAGVRADMEALRFNTAIAKLIELTNRATARSAGQVSREIIEPLVLMLSPFAPHLGEELWRRLGHDESIAYADYPLADPALLRSPTVTYPVQVNGKVRGRIEVPAEASEADVRAGALAAVATVVGDWEPRTVIVVPGKIVNVVLRAASDGALTARFPAPAQRSAASDPARPPGGDEALG
jgi:leucyl-tRNA synthetase